MTAIYLKKSVKIRFLTNFSKKRFNGCAKECKTLKSFS